MCEDVQTTCQEVTESALLFIRKAHFNVASSLNEPIALALAELAKYERAVFLGGSQVANPDVRT